MAQRRFHYEQAFEHYLRANAIPYVAVDEAKRALRREDRHGSLPIKPQELRLRRVFSEGGENLLMDVKGRKHSGQDRAGNFQNWVTRDDVGVPSETWAGHLRRRVRRPTFAFLFWCLCYHVCANGQPIVALRAASTITE